MLKKIILLSCSFITLSIYSLLKLSSFLLIINFISSIVLVFLWRLHLSPLFGNFSLITIFLALISFSPFPRPALVLLFFFLSGLTGSILYIRWSVFCVELLLLCEYTPKLIYFSFSMSIHFVSVVHPALLAYIWSSYVSFALVFVHVFSEQRP